MSRFSADPNQNPLKQEFMFKGINGELVKVELGYQGYDVIFEPHDLKIGDPLFRSPFKKNGDYRVIQPLIWLEAKKARHQDGPRVINKFDPPLKFSVEYTMDIFKDVDPPVAAEEIVIAVLNERGEPNWEPYPTSITSLGPDKWMATIAIVEWTSHTCYGR
jgi:hypothetical protein